MTYTDYIETMIKKKPIATPIFTAEISKEMEIQFQLPPAKASAATSVAIKRIMDRKTIPSLRFYQKGIYYKTAVTPFGEMGIDKEQLIVIWPRNNGQPKRLGRNQAANRRS